MCLICLLSTCCGVCEVSAPCLRRDQYYRFSVSGWGRGKRERKCLYDLQFWHWYFLVSFLEGGGKLVHFPMFLKYWHVLFSPLSFTSPLGQRVAEVSDHWWYSMLILPPLLKDSVAAPFLAAYYPDCVGMSPSCTSTNRSPGESNLVKLEHLKSVPNVTGKGHLLGSVA